MRLTTCGRCGGTAAPAPEGGWRHCADTPRTHGHAVDPDDGYVSGPDRSDREPCNACGHPAHDDTDVCEEPIGSGLFGTDGVQVPAWCPCTGSVPARTATVPDPWTDPDAAAAHQPPPF